MFLSLGSQFTLGILSSHWPVVGTVCLTMSVEKNPAIKWPETFILSGLGRKHLEIIWLMGWAFSYQQVGTPS